MRSRATIKQIEYINMLKDGVPEDDYIQIRINTRTKVKPVEELTSKAASRIINSLIHYKRTGEVKQSRSDSIAEMEERLRRLRRKLRNG